MASSNAGLIKLAPDDNVIVVGRSLSAGEKLTFGNLTMEISQSLSLGHKLASRDISTGETITKYNFPIGVATANIKFGEHVHVHNMRSNYTPTYVVPEED